MSKKNFTAEQGLPVEVVENLCNRWNHDHDQKAFKKLLNAYMYVINLVINRYRNYRQDRDNLVEEGRIGIFEAAKDFTPGKGTFAHFAYFKVLNRIGTAAKSGYAIAIPKEVMEKRKLIERARDRYECEHGIEPSYYKLAELTGLDEEEVYKYEFEPLGGICLDDHDFDQDSESDDEASLIGINPQSADYALIQDETVAELNQVLDKSFSKRDAKIIRMVYGLGNDNEKAMNDREISEKIGITSARVGQIKNAAIEQLQKHFNCRA